MFNLRGTAYFQDLGAFLADFENEFPYLRVQNLELEPAASGMQVPSEAPPELVAAQAAKSFPLPLRPPQSVWRQACGKLLDQLWQLIQGSQAEESVQCCMQ